MRWGVTSNTAIRDRRFPPKGYPITCRLNGPRVGGLPNPFNHVVINHTETATTTCPCTPTMSRAGRNPTIAAISLGVERLFTMCPI